jgi:glutamate synthase (NADPH/NADH)
VSDGNGRVAGINTVRVEWTKDPLTGKWSMREVDGSDQFFPADLVLLALGFLGPEERLINSLGLKTDTRTNIETRKGKYSTAVPGVSKNKKNKNYLYIYIYLNFLIIKIII